MGKSVVVVGGGLAGLSATVEAVNNGATVTLVEKENNTGGNSAKATSGINGAVTCYQEKQNINDSLESFQDDTLKSGHGLCKPDLVEVLVKNSKEAVEWVSNSFDVELSKLSQCGGHSAPRTHREPPRPDGKPSPVGFDIVSALKKRVLQMTEEGKVTVLTNTRCKDLITESKDGQVVCTGIRVEKDGAQEDIKCGAVVLTCGGYACDFTETSLLKKYTPHLCHLPTTNGPFAVGDGVKMGERIGCSLILMDQVQVHPTSFVDPKDPCAAVKFLGPEALRGCGGVMVNQKGERFYNELGRRDDVSNAIFKNCSPLPSHAGQERCPSAAYLIMNDEACEKFGLPNLGFYKFKGFVRPFDNAAAVAKEIGCEESVLLKTLEDYGRVSPDPFGKTAFPVLFKNDEKLWLSIITPALHYSMGGLEINPNAQILATMGDSKVPVVNLFGAGEVTGGVHGGNRLAGNSLLECVVFGRIAGQQAAAA